jgi:hypothetical protein
VKTWTQERIDEAILVLGQSQTVVDAAYTLGVPYEALQSGFRRYAEHPAGWYLGRASEHPRLPCVPNLAVNPDLDRLVAAIRKRTHTLESLSDALDLCPSKVRVLIADAQTRGIAVRLSGEAIGLGHNPRTWQDMPDIVQPTVGVEQKVGVISDLHAGSKYCLRAQIRDLVGQIYDSGAREILCPGDWLDGCYNHGLFELTCSGIEDQTADLCETLPSLPGLTYHGITGNHDETFTKPTGCNVGRYIEGYFRDHGRDDIRFHGDRGAYLKIRGTIVNLWHPKGSCSYALSYKLQKRVENYSSGEKPGILLTGHYHRSCYLFTRGVHAFACPAMQGPGSAFEKSLGAGPAALGGLLLGWTLTDVGTIRRLRIDPISYFVHEQPREIQCET